MHEITPLEQLNKNYTIFWFENMDGFKMFGAIHNSVLAKYDRNTSTDE